MWKQNVNPEPEFGYDMNPYDSFMKKHLQHYGYYTGRNANFRSSLTAFEEWEKNNGYAGSESSDSEFENEALKDKDKDDDDDGSYGYHGYHGRYGRHLYQDDPDEKTKEDLLKTTQLVYGYQHGKMVPKLREPRSLYGFSANEYGPQQSARWPSEIQVLAERIHHIPYVPPSGEPFYKPSFQEKMPMSRSCMGEGRVVFEYEPVVGTFFLRSRVGGCRTGCTKAAVDLKDEADNTLIFESRFESGNLAKAVQINDYDYELWLRNDLYTNRHTQWYYFRASNTRANVTYRFTIVNLQKPDSLYNTGMRPLMYSEKNARDKKVGWIRSGSEIKYYKNNVKYTSGKVERCYYSLTWTVQFEHNHDTVYFAHCFPYTYSDMQDYVNEIANDPVKAKICKQRVLCRTLAGNMVYLLTITSPNKNPDDSKVSPHKKAVVVTSRVHPGESNASWMMKGFLDYLLSNSPDAKLLRDTFIFKIVPMLNPDGVIVGNYRCSLAGRDLNRNYKTVLKDSFPSVWHTRNMIKKLSEEREIVAYCDLHGHSRKQNVFIYGCENRGNPQRRLRERIFPVMLGKNAPDKFQFESCKFKIQKSKEGTGRIVMWNMGIMNSYTMEATFCGSSLGKLKGFHFSTADFEAMGYHFCDTLLDYCDPDQSKCAKILLDLEERLRQEILQHLKKKEGEEQRRDPHDINLDDDYTSDVESSDGGSDSSVSDGLPVHLQYAADKLPKKKRLKTRKEREKKREPKKLQATPITADNEKKDKEKKETESQATAPPKKEINVNDSPTNVNKKHSGKRPRSRDDRSNNGIPIFVQERVDDRKSKNTPSQDGYLEALTNAYIRSGVLVNEAQKEVPHFRYTAGARPVAGIPQNIPQTLDAARRMILQRPPRFKVTHRSHHHHAKHPTGISTLDFPMENIDCTSYSATMCNTRTKSAESCSSAPSTHNAGARNRKCRSESNSASSVRKLPSLVSLFSGEGAIGDKGVDKLEVAQGSRSRPEQEVKPKVTPRSNNSGSDPYVLMKYQQAGSQMGYLAGRQVWAGAEGQGATTSDLPTVAPTSIRKVLQMTPREGSPLSPSQWLQLGVTGRKTHVQALERRMRDETIAKILAITSEQKGDNDSVVSSSGLCEMYDIEELPRYKYSLRKTNSAKSERAVPAVLERRPSQRHLVELSVAQQRQAELQQQDARRHSATDRDVDSPIKQHPAPFDESLDRDRPHDYVKPRGHSARSRQRSAVQRPLSGVSAVSGRARSARSYASHQWRHESLEANMILGPAEGTRDQSRDQGEERWNAPSSDVSYPRDQQPSPDESPSPVPPSPVVPPSPAIPVGGGGALSRVSIRGQTPYVPLRAGYRGGTPREEHAAIAAARAGRINSSHRSHSNQYSNQYNNAPAIIPMATQPHRISGQSVKPVTPTATKVYTSGSHGNQYPSNGHLNNQYSNQNGNHGNQHSNQAGPAADTEITDTIKSINEIRQDLLSPRKRANLSPTTGQFVEHFVKKTDEEISDITAQLNQQLKDHISSGSTQSLAESTGQGQTVPQGQTSGQGQRGQREGRRDSCGSAASVARGDNPHPSGSNQGQEETPRGPGGQGSVRRRPSTGALAGVAVNGTARRREGGPAPSTASRGPRPLPMPARGEETGFYHGGYVYANTNSNQGTYGDGPITLSTVNLNMPARGEGARESRGVQEGDPRPDTEADRRKEELPRRQRSGPTKISLMIAQGHEECPRGSFHAKPLTRPAPRTSTFRAQTNRKR